WYGSTLFGRAENAQKNELFEAPSPLAGKVFDVSAFSLGYVYDIPVIEHLELGLGAMGSVYALPSAIQPPYASPPPSHVFFTPPQSRIGEFDEPPLQARASRSCHGVRRRRRERASIAEKRKPKAKRGLDQQSHGNPHRVQRRSRDRLLRRRNRRRAGHCYAGGR